MMEVKTKESIQEERLGGSLRVLTVPRVVVVVVVVGSVVSLGLLSTRLET